MDFDSRPRKKQCRVENERTHPRFACARRKKWLTFNVNQHRVGALVFFMLCTCAECEENAYRYPYDLGFMRATRPELEETFQVLSAKADDMMRGGLVPRDAHEQLRDAFLQQLYARDPQKYALSFHEANALDDYFLGVGANECWRTAYNLPQEGQAMPGRTRAKQVGMFTFTIETDPPVMKRT